MKRISIILLTAATSFAVGCGTDPGTSGGDDGTTDGTTKGDEWDKELGKREVDYNAALRIAALRLTGDIPTMAEINQILNAPDLAAKKAAYEGLVQTYMGRTTFARQMQFFWRDTFKMGETAEMDTAPTFAAMLSVQNGDYTQLFKASTGACPTLDINTGVFTPADCAGAGPKVGVLSNQGVMKQFYSNFAFRRVKWVQETFDCTKFPIEQTGAPTDVGAAVPFTGSYPFQSISGKDNGGRVDFHDVSGVICAGCHVNINHQAPLFANFDMNGAYQTTISVKTPLPMEPLAVLTDYLPAGEPLSWRSGVPTPDLASYGAAMAADTGIAQCAVARMWNWAMGHGDVVDALREVPPETIQAQVDAFTQSGFKMKDLIYAVYTSDDFVKF
ncbi:MAG TPA: hypothetical protein VN253_16060 [Kofleriaceae bacterium]|nr:hypothetical protein [Kofleriaceae bacterium]